MCIWTFLTIKDRSKKIRDISNDTERKVEEKVDDYTTDEFNHEDYQSVSKEISITTKEDKNQANHVNNLNRNEDFDPCLEPDAPKYCFGDNDDEHKKTSAKPQRNQHSGKN